LITALKGWRFVNKVNPVDRWLERVAQDGDMIYVGHQPDENEWDGQVLLKDIRLLR